MAITINVNNGANGLQHCMWRKLVLVTVALTAYFVAIISFAIQTQSSKSIY